MTPPSPQDPIRFILSLGRALHTYGYPADQLEEVLEHATHRLGLIGQFFSTPTSIFASFGPQDEQRTFLIRVQPGDVNLGKLAQLDEVTRAVLRGVSTPAHGARRVAEIVAAPPPYGPVLTTVAYGIASGAGSRFLGGGAREVIVATVIGIVIGLLALGAGRIPALGRIFELVAAFIAIVLASAAAAAFGSYSVFTATLAGIIVLLPGLTLTVAVRELSTRHLASGTARLSAAFATFLGIAFGVALGGRLAGILLELPPATEPLPLPGWTLAVALIVVPLAFAVLLRAQPGDSGWIVAAGVLAFFGGRIGAGALGVELGVFIGALTVGIASNVYARLRDRPAMVTMVPGIILLVPGTIGYRSFASLLEREVVLGLETAFTMFLMAVALAAGLLIAGIVGPARGDGGQWAAVGR